MDDVGLEGGEPRVTFLVDHYHKYGGIKWNIDQLAAALVSEGWSVSLVAFDGDTREEYEDGTKEIVRTRSPRFFPPAVSHLNYKVYAEMNRLEDRTDLFHVFNTFAAAGAGCYKLLGGTTPVVSTLNNWGLVCPALRLEVGDPLTKHGALERAICTFSEASSPLEKVGAIPYSQYFALERTIPGKRLDRYAALSDYVKRVYVANGFDENRIDVIGHHIDRRFLDAVDEWKATRSTRPSRGPSKELRVLYVGRLTENKGIELLLDAVDRVSGPVDLRIAGVGPLSDRVSEVSERRDDVTYLGFIDREELPRYYLDADLFVHPVSRPEPMGKTIMESLYCDLPILCSDIGSSPEVAGEACVTFEAGSVESLVSELQALCQDRERLRRMSNSCADERSPYTFETVYENLTSLYESLLETQLAVSTPPEPT